MEKTHKELNVLSKTYKEKNINHKEIKKKINFIYNQEYIFQTIKRQAKIYDCDIVSIFEEKNDKKSNLIIQNSCFNITFESDYEDNIFKFIKKISRFFLFKIEKIEMSKVNKKIIVNIILKIFFKN